LKPPLCVVFSWVIKRVYIIFIWNTISESSNLDICFIITSQNSLQLLFCYYSLQIFFFICNLYSWLPCGSTPVLPDYLLLWHSCTWDKTSTLWSCQFTNHNKLSVIAQVFTIKLEHRLGEIGYDRIVECARNILPERNKLKENFYTTKSMMKPLGLGYQKINICPNFFMLYYFENADLTEYRTCGHARYKPRTSKEMTCRI